MRQYSPTSLRVFAECCPAALMTYLESRREKIDEADDVEGPEAAEIGIAAHAMIHATALARKAGKPAGPAIEAAAVALGTRMSPLRVIKARELAADFSTWYEFPSDMEHEHGVAFDKDWKGMEWDSPERKIRMVFDSVGLLRVDHPDAGEITEIVVRDYKTGWACHPDDLNGIQFDALCVGALRLYPAAEAIKLELVSVRTRQTYSVEYAKENEDDAAELGRRRERIEFVMACADATDGQHRCGVGCGRCNYMETCEAYQRRVRHLRKAGVDLALSGAEIARDFAVMETQRAIALGKLEEIARVSGPIRVDGKAVGYWPGETRTVTDPCAILDVWLATAKIRLDPGTLSAIRGLIQTIKPGVTDLEAVVNRCAKGMGYSTQKEAREAVMEKYTASVVKPKWGWKTLPAEAPKT